MTPEQQQYFEAMEALFGSLGWQVFIDEIQGFKDAISGKWPTIKPEHLQHDQGRYEAFNQILGYQKMVEGTKESALEAARVPHPDNLQEGYD